MANLLLCTDEGLHILNLLGGIIAGAELETGSDQPPVFKMTLAARCKLTDLPISEVEAIVES